MLPQLCKPVLQRHIQLVDAPSYLLVLSCSHCIVDIVNFGNQSVNLFLAYSLDLIMVFVRYSAKHRTDFPTIKATKVIESKFYHHYDTLFIKGRIVLCEFVRYI